MSGLKFSESQDGCGKPLPAEQSVRAKSDGGLQRFTPISRISCGDRYYGVGAEHNLYHQCEECHEKSRRGPSAEAV